jgi:hypothetical protein
MWRIVLADTAVAGACTCAGLATYVFRFAKDGKTLGWRVRRLFGWAWIDLAEGWRPWMAVAILTGYGGIRIGLELAEPVVIERSVPVIYAPAEVLPAQPVLPRVWITHSEMLALDYDGRRWQVRRNPDKACWEWLAPWGWHPLRDLSPGF